MRKITFSEPVLKIEGLETKFDVVPVSNSLAILIGDRDLATIVQQLSYWTFQGYGEVIDGVRWFYKPIAELSDGKNSLPNIKFKKAIASGGNQKIRLIITA